MSKNQKVENENTNQENKPKRTYTKEQTLKFIEKKKSELTPETVMPWGKYKGTSLCLFWINPDNDRLNYLNWLQDKIKFGDYNYYLIDYIEDHMTK